MTQNYDELLKMADTGFRGTIVEELAAATRTLQVERDAAYNQAIEDAAKIIDKGQEEINSVDNLRYIAARSRGNLMGTAYAPAIRQLKRPTP